METAKPWHMLHLHRTKTSFLKTLFLVLAFIASVFSVSAQQELHLEEHDAKPYYFGISLGINRAGFKTSLHPSFLQQDSIRVAEPRVNGGFALGLSATLRLNHRFELRFNPQLIFAERNLYYKLNPNHPADIDFGHEVIKKVESVITTFPLHLKFRSDRIGNFRVYMFGGGKFDLDLASNAKARRAEDMIKIGATDYGIEAGMGFNFYFPSFILSPEIKISNGVNNMHERQEGLKYSRNLEGIQSRMIMFTIHIEG
jgi:hypothetical protein